MSIPPTTPTTATAPHYQQQPRLPIVEVVKVYGKLAGRECFGVLAPVGSSCQITREDLYTKLGFFNKDDNHHKTAVNRDDFRHLLNDELEFHWPLKPFGVAGSVASLVKTATMNKSVETRLYNQLLETYHLYNPHNPTSPLPSSLRPQLNQILQRQGIVDQATIDAVYRRLLAVATSAAAADDDDSGTLPPTAFLTRERLDATLFAEQKDALDFYEFLDYLGVDNISWKVATEDNEQYQEQQ